MTWHAALYSVPGRKLTMRQTGTRLNVAVAGTIRHSPMREIRRSELVEWLKVVPTSMSCFMGAAPAPPRDVLLELLEREWVRYAKDGRLVRTDKGHSVSEHE
jgi:hypothetical protein